MTKLIGWFFVIAGTGFAITGVYKGTNVDKPTDTNKKIEAVNNNVIFFSGLILLAIAASIFVSNVNAGKD